MLSVYNLLAGNNSGLRWTANQVADVLNFLSEIAKEGVMKDWLGGPEGNIFWPSLLGLLCNTPAAQASATHASLFGTHKQKVKLIQT